LLSTKQCHALLLREHVRLLRGMGADVVLDLNLGLHPVEPLSNLAFDAGLRRRDPACFCFSAARQPSLNEVLPAPA
jgi:hypothetical protein